MSKIDLYDPKWVDMVFADKNKAYGAYQLRKSVSQRNIKALVILLVAAFIGGGYLAYQIKKHKDELAAQEAYAAKMELAALEQAKKEQAERKKQQKKEEPKKVEPEKVVPETRATVKFTAPVIKDDKDVKEEMPPMVKMNKETKAIGTETKEGVEDRNIVADRSTVATPEQIIPKIEKPVAEAPKVEAPKEDIEKKIFTFAEQQPTFKGNVQAWLTSHLNYPASAADNNIQGKVVVKFVVGRDGSVSRAEVVRGVDPALDREALRVVNSMPKWNPGMNNGQPANVWFQLPITFKLN
ncbi:MAG: TonB family protein [Prevotella pallens]|jgi:tonB family C-terminal domain|uniref:energy transducer TonB n=1 Tax=Prevotella pallens TaxID=60133 RepID=UPI001CAE9B4D|nr:energy transducer TonB [Prevotella pallens]MBF1442121.1 TonB family protein [Prevotella pallens]MBF1469878.1 TonB family protein [Prevotella pallens]MBF1479605.1 TonB family protein [Prevotella pallens]MBF1481359.1 TonB family protein [Prevotella pallens]MBF1499869.1 TonB family protein [Prevotella pallens]